MTSSPNMRSNERWLAARSAQLTLHRHVMRLTFLTLLLLPLFCCSCSMLLVNTVPTKTGRAVQSGAKREVLVERLGQPHHSDAAPISVTAKRFPTNSASCARDVYQVSGLTQIPGDPYESDWNVYPAFFFLSAGLTEVYLFPKVAVDMTLRSFRHYEIIAWYDCADRLVAFERRKRESDDQ
jgi:hypothetical protein